LSFQNSDEATDYQVTLKVSILEKLL